MLGLIVHDDPRVWNGENPDVCLMINFKVTFFYSKKRTSDPGGINTHLLQFYYLYYLLCKQLNIKQQLKGQREFWAAIRIEIKFLLP